ncbi:penicillin-binding protein 2 [Chloroflexota bacterium]|nr:penicillin-binding protein 2 [Chloroflexota bacterium]
MNSAPQGKKTFDGWRFLVLYILIGMVFGYYLLRLFDIQILQGVDFIAQADENRTQVISDPAVRGTIYDRNGFVLAKNVPSYNVVVIPGYLPEDDGDTQQIYRELSELVGIPVTSGETDEEAFRNFTPCYTDLGISEIIYIAATNWPYQETAVACNVSEKVAMIVMENRDKWPGIDVAITPVRQYPTGDLTAEIIGFLGPVPAALEEYYTELGLVANRDKVGYAGVEQSLNAILSGTNGTRTVEVDVAGEIVRNLEEPIDPIPGNDVTLTIDARLQAVAREALISEIEFWNYYAGRTLANSGVVMAMIPSTGEILALVSYPNYENNRLEQSIPSYYYQQLSEDPQRPLFNTAISAELPPGSVFKLAPALGILNEGVVTPEQTVNCPGTITITEKYYENDPGSPREYVCWDRAGHDDVNYLWGIAYSCDVYWYKVGGGYDGEVEDGGLGPWRIGEYARALGYGTLSGIELPGEAEGLIPDPTWKRITVGENWSIGDTYIATMGQGYVLSTPLQVMNSIATIANGGHLMEVTIVDKITEPDGTLVEDNQPTERWNITTDPVINTYDGNTVTGENKTVQPWVIQLANEGMRLVVTDGTAEIQFDGDPYNSAGKTGTAEYCDDVAQAQDLCKSGAWPAHAWYVGYAPWDNPEIIVVAFVYSGEEGSTFSAPIVRQVIDAYFEMKATDTYEGD